MPPRFAWIAVAGIVVTLATCAYARRVEVQTNYRGEGDGYTSVQRGLPLPFYETQSAPDASPKTDVSLPFLLVDLVVWTMLCGFVIERPWRRRRSMRDVYRDGSD
jgi:hypothetical protein